jgi:hypothetical protein
VASVEETSMKRHVGVVALVLALPVPVLANFGLFPRQVTVSAYYYPVWYYPAYRVPAAVCVPAPIYTAPAVPGPATQTMPRIEESSTRPQVRPSVEAAPPSSAPIFPKPKIEAESSRERSEFIPEKRLADSSARVLRSYVPQKEDEPYFEARAVKLDAALRPKGYTILFVNVSQEALLLEVAGKKHTLPAGERLLVESDQELRWKVGDRPAETSRVPSRDEALVVTIRR